MKYSQCGNCSNVFLVKEKQTMYCSLECEQQHDLFLRKNEFNNKYMISASENQGKTNQSVEQLNARHKQHVKMIKELGFMNVRLYEDVGEGAYYDAVSPQGKKAEVVIKSDKSEVLWRELHPCEIKWFPIEMDRLVASEKKNVDEGREQLTLVI
ncbi:hypothetical protein [Priestia flexa]|uniref:hypothetical protein n=1 Tax=Priestia flexa TaxID=86664 RepID=UPI002492CE78|nr:hypothetical protein [Priestia flexa]